MIRNGKLRDQRPRVVRCMALAAVLVAFPGIVLLDFFFRSRGIAFYVQRPHLILICLLDTFLAAGLIHAISRTEVWGEDGSYVNARPFRLVVIVWGLAMVFVAGIWPAFDAPWTTYVLEMLADSLFFAVIAVGVILLGKHRAKQTLFLVVIVTMLIYASFATLVLNAPSPDVVSLLLPLRHWVMVVSLIALIGLAVRGWVRFFTAGKGAGEIAGQGRENQGGASSRQADSRY